MKKKAGLLFALCLNMISLSGCSEILNASIGAKNAVEAMAEASDDAMRFEITESDYRTENAEYTKIDLENPGQSESLAYTWAEQSLTIHQAGAYVLQGTLEGNLVISVFNDEMVHLILDNVKISSDRGPAIYVEKASKAVITAAEGSENIISDSAAYGCINACIFSNSDLTINGSGMLNVYGYHEDAIRSKDLLKAVNANLFVKANEDGMRGNDGVIVFDSTVEIESEGTGIRSVSDKDMIMIQGGACKIIAGKHAVSANRHVSIHASLVDLYSIEEMIRCNGVKDIEEGIIS